MWQFARDEAHYDMLALKCVCVCVLYRIICVMYEFCMTSGLMQQFACDEAQREALKARVSLIQPVRHRSSCHTYGRVTCVLQCVLHFKALQARGCRTFSWCVIDLHFIHVNVL